MGFVLDAVGEIKLKKLKSLEGIGLYPSTEAASKAIKEMLPLEASQRKVSDMTAQVAQAAFAKGNVYLSLRDEIVQIYEDRDFIKLYPKKGQPGIHPWRLALVSVLQYMEQIDQEMVSDATKG